VLTCTDFPFIESPILILVVAQFVPTSVALSSIDHVSAEPVFSLVVCDSRVPLQIFASSLSFLLYMRHPALDVVFNFKSSGQLAYRVISLRIHCHHQIDLDYQLKLSGSYQKTLC